MGITAWTVAGALGAAVFGVTAFVASPVEVEASPDGTLAPAVQSRDHPPAAMEG